MSIDKTKYFCINCFEELSLTQKRITLQYCCDNCETRFKKRIAFIENNYRKITETTSLKELANNIIQARNKRKIENMTNRNCQKRYVNDN